MSSVAKKMSLSLVMASVVTVMGVNEVVFAGQEENRKQLVATNSCPGCDLSGVNLDRLQMQGANLEGANLSQAKVRLSSLAKANLRRANLQNAQFGGSDLADADLRGANVQGATFAGAYMVGLQLDKGVVLNQTTAEAAVVSDQAAPEQKPVAPAVPPAAVSSAPVTPPVEEPGLLDKTWGGITGLFGAGEDGPQKKEAAAMSVKDASSVPTEQPAVQKTAVPTSSVEKKPVASVPGKSEAAAPEEPGLLDKTWSGLTGLFGQNEGAEKPKGSLSAEKQERPADEVASSVTASPPVPQPVVAERTVAAPSVPEKSVPEKFTTVIAQTESAASPHKAEKAEEPGLLDKTWSGITGLFTSDEEGAKQEGAAPAEKSVVSTADQVDRPIPAPVKTTVAPVPVTPPVPTTVVNEPPAEIAESVVLEGEPVVPIAPAVAPVVGRKEAVVQAQEKTGAKTGDAQEKTPKTTTEVPAVVANATPVLPVSEADMQVAKEKNRLQTLDSKKCYGCKLQGVDFAGKNLSGVDFEGADLTGSNLAGADLEGGNLKGAVLVGANLRGADLQGADLYKANLSKADLTDANLKDALLDDAQFVDTVGYKP